MSSDLEDVLNSYGLSQRVYDLDWLSDCEEKSTSDCFLHLCNLFIEQEACLLEEVYDMYSTCLREEIPPGADVTTVHKSVDDFTSELKKVFGKKLTCINFSDSVSSNTDVLLSGAKMMIQSLCIEPCYGKVAIYKILGKRISWVLMLYIWPADVLKKTN